MRYYCTYYSLSPLGVGRKDARKTSYKYLCRHVFGVPKEEACQRGDATLDIPLDGNDLQKGSEREGLLEVTSGVDANPGEGGDVTCGRGVAEVLVPLYVCNMSRSLRHVL